MKKYFKHKIKSLLLVNKIVVIHYLELEKKFFHPEERHDFWEMVCAVNGKVCVTADGKEFQLNDGDIYFHKPNEVHSLAVKESAKTGVFVLSFECLSEAMGFFKERKVSLNKRQMKIILDIIETAKKTYDITFYNLDTDIMNLLPQPTLGGEQLIQNNVETLLIDVMRSMTETEGGNDVFLQETEINNKIAEEVIKFLKNNIEAKLCIEDIAKAINYSKAYLFRQFKLSIGKSIMEYYLELKIKKAKEFLKNGSLSVKEIAEKLCFDTPNYFTKSFKKVVGLTPTEYKKRALA